MKANAAVYFPGLNGLRFFAALAVVLGHVLFAMDRSGFRLASWRSQLLSLQGINVFFILSGFLITYLLLTEQRETGGVALGRFYLRRALRIWPLYYFAVAIVLVVVPALFEISGSRPRSRAWETSPTMIAGLLLLVPGFTGAPRFLFHLSTIGVLQQFYLVWPLLLRLVKRLRWLCFGLIALYFTGYLLALNPTGFRRWGFFLAMRFDLLAVGALAAQLLFHERRGLLAVVYHPAVQLLAFVGLVVEYFTPRFLLLRWGGLHMLCFAVIILNLASNPRSLLKLRGPFFEGLGRRAYALYVVHPLVTSIVLGLAVPLFARQQRSLSLKIAIAAACVVASYIAAFVVSLIVERPFLWLKRRFAVIASGEDARLQLEGKNQDPEGDEQRADDGAAIEPLLEEERGGEGHQDVGQG